MCVFKYFFVAAFHRMHAYIHKHTHIHMRARVRMCECACACVCLGVGESVGEHIYVFIKIFTNRKDIYLHLP